MKKLIQLITVVLFAILLSSFSNESSKTIIPVSGWKIKFGDNLKWAKPDFDDSKWPAIKVDKPWDFYGYKNRVGYAWYRAKVFIPASLKKQTKYSEIMINIGKVDDADQTYLNGALIGQNGQSYKIVSEGKKVKFKRAFLWQVPRKYLLSINDSRIKWGQENVIAVRVWNGHSLGGIFDAKPAKIEMATPYIRIDKKSFAYNITNGTNFQKSVNVINHSEKNNIKGKFTITVKDVFTKEKVFEKNINLNVKTKEKINFSFSTKPRQNCVTTYKFVSTISNDVFTTRDYVPYILTPHAPAKPRINGPTIYGARPGRDFLYKMPVSGEKPIYYNVNALPPSLKIDNATGIITGKTPAKGKYQVTFIATNTFGVDKKKFTIISGDNLALTPPLGWNSWNCWSLNVSTEKIKISAKKMVESGLADYGFTYINIDDGWEAAKRTEKGVLLGNKKFPDFPALAGYVHGLGLKLGIYSSPGPHTCGGHLGSYQHEFLDAKTWGDWGIDYLKYDWCSYGKIAKDRSLPELKKPYILMRKALNKVNRDIVYSLCQYGRGEVWKWGREIGGNLWRTTGDIGDTWESLESIGFSQNKMSPYAAPGGWNDPDMLIVGRVGWGSNLHPTRLTPDEQYTHISLWSLLSAPLLLGNDLARLDEFTLNLLINNEVLNINQDSLGKQANKVFDADGIQYWLKELSDGSYALGIFNLNDEFKKHNLKLKNAGLKGMFKARNVWRQTNIGVITNQTEITIPVHGVFLIKLTKK
ncbi:putative Ig domain-containing protein [bacterium]|nr:putative Ig domain-containing protein [bacterium]